MYDVEDDDNFAACVVLDPIDRDVGPNNQYAPVTLQFWTDATDSRKFFQKFNLAKYAPDRRLGDAPRGYLQQVERNLT